MLQEAMRIGASVHANTFGWHFKNTKVHLVSSLLQLRKQITQAQCFKCAEKGCGEIFCQLQKRIYLGYPMTMDKAFHQGIPPFTLERVPPSAEEYCTTHFSRKLYVAPSYTAMIVYREIARPKQSPC